MPIYPRTLKDGTTVYDVKNRIAGRQVMKRGLTWDEAQDVELKQLIQKRAIKTGVPLGLQKVEDFSKIWLEERKQQVEQSTWIDNEQALKLRILPYFGRRRLVDLTPYEIQNFVHKFAKQPRTGNKTLTTLKIMLKDAVVWGWLAQSPAAEVKRIPQHQEEMAYLTPDEAGKLFAVVEGQHRLFLLAVMCSGLRSGELRALKWGDLDGDYIQVRRSTRKGVVKERVKTKHGRRKVAIPPILKAELEAMRGKPGEFIFTKDGKPLGDHYPTKSILYPALERAKIKKHVTFHELRHSYAAWMVTEGESIKFLQNQLGHATAEFTMDKYGHFMPEKHAEVMARFEDQVVSKWYHGDGGNGGNVVSISKGKRRSNS